MAHDLTCLRCGNQWTTKNDKVPRVCPTCNSSAWNRPKKAERPNPVATPPGPHMNERGGLPRPGAGTLVGYPWNGEPKRLPYTLDDERWKPDLEDGYLRTYNCIPLEGELPKGFEFDFSIEVGDVGKTRCVHCKTPHTEPFFFYRKAFDARFPRTKLARLVTRCMSCGIFGNVFYHDPDATEPHPRVAAAV